MNRTYAPHDALLFKHPECEVRLGEVAGFTEKLEMIDGRATAFVCTEGACSTPLTDPGRLAEVMAAASGPGDTVS